MSNLFSNMMVLIVSFVDILHPIMFFMFVGGISTRLLVYYTVKREEWFVYEFEKRMVKQLDHDRAGGPQRSFYVMLKRMLERTFYESFEVRSVMRRRRMDHIMSPADRAFLIQSGCAYLVRDTLKAINGLKKSENRDDRGDMGDVARTVLANNPCFSRVMGVAPIGTVNDFLGQLPGLFIVVGILGTFLGIIKGLPELGGMDLNDPAATKTVMDEFLVRVAFSMGASAFGIICSITMQVFNSFINPEMVFDDVCDKYEQLLNYLWRRAENNDVPNGLSHFDEHRDPSEALAELSLQKELTAASQKKSFFGKADDNRSSKSNPSTIPTGQTGVFQNLPPQQHQAQQAAQQTQPMMQAPAQQQYQHQPNAPQYAPQPQQAPAPQPQYAPQPQQAPTGYPPAAGQPNYTQPYQPGQYTQQPAQPAQPASATVPPTGPTQDDPNKKKVA